MLPSLICQRCDTDGRTPDGTTCSVCMGSKTIVAMCELCKTDMASHWNDNGEPECDVCTATRNRNEAA